MRVFLTGGTGFIGGEVARRLRDRGDAVVALVRTPGQAAGLAELGCDLVAGTVTDRETVREAVAGCDAVVHAAAVYEVGIPASARPAMYETNVTGTETVLCAALDAGVGKVVYVSTVAAFGNTEGKVVDETYQHCGRYTSYYDETKHLAHQVARKLIAEGLPCVIVQPGAVYGPGDHSQVGNQIRQFLAGRLPAVAFPDMGLTLVHRDDVADGILLALDKGRVGEQYVLGGEVGTLGGLLRTVADAAGRRPPRVTMPAVLVRAVVPLGPVVGKLLGYPPNLRELVTSADGVTFWACDDKARAELGYAPRPLAAGVRDLLTAGA